MPRYKRAVAQISDGALNGFSRWRALERQVGASRFTLALAQRLRIATELLADLRLTITHVACASGFQSLRRFNAAFRQHFQMSPSEWRQRGAPG